MNPIRMVAFGLVSFLAAGANALAGNWPAWRGPTADGITTEKNLPTKWSKTENVRWRTPLMDRGNSTPIVWGNKVFVTQAIEKTGERLLLCYDRATGKLIWQNGIVYPDKEITHGTNPHCSASPATDGERVIVSFASGGLFCYDLNGKELWKRTDLGKVVHIWGSATSPMIYGDICFLNFGPGETTYLLAVNKKTGATLWKKDEETGYGKPPTADVRKSASSKNAGPMATDIGSWSTPVIMKVEGKDQVLISWPRRLVAYEPQTGKEVWNCSGLNPLVYSSPIYADGIVVAMGGYGGRAIAVRAGGSGDVTSSRRLWEDPKEPQRIGSGVIHDGHIYIHNDPGTAHCIDLKTGKVVWNERMTGAAPTGQNWSSVMLSGDNCYTITQGGDCFVFKASPTFQMVSVNSLGERCNSSIVPSDGELFIRTHQALWCISEKKK